MGMALHHVKHRKFVRNNVLEEHPPPSHLSENVKSDSGDGDANRTTVFVIEDAPATLKTASSSNADQDDDYSSSSSEADSVLSEPELRRDYWEDCKALRPKPESLQEKWELLERQFQKRERLLNRISKGKNKTFVRQILEREHLVRRQAFDALLLAEVGDEAEKKDLCKRLEEEKGSALESHLLEKSPRRSFSHRFYDYLIFEMNSVVPAVFSLVIHSIVHISIYDGLNSCLLAVKKMVAKSGESPEIDSYLFGTAFFLGFILIRFTGDLYWWLSDKDYDLVKFDFHNRRRLGYWDARILSTVRVRKILRVSMYVIGYNLCYLATSEFQFTMERFFDQRKEIIENLPSVKFQIDQGICLAAREESFCARSCQDEIRRQGTCV
jgi:hypothetical protein